MKRDSENLLAIALANYGTHPNYIDDDKGFRYMTISYEYRGGDKWAWYVGRPGEELGPFKARLEAAIAAQKAGWMPKSFGGLT